MTRPEEDGPTVSEEITRGVAGARDRLQTIVADWRGPVCAHDVCVRAGLDASDPGAISFPLMVLGSLARPWKDQPARVGSALVAVRAAGLLTPEPRDRYLWALAPGIPAGAEGLAGFGVEWQGSILASKVRDHAALYPRVRFADPHHRPDITL